MKNVIVNEEPKYRKKSTAKGQPRSKHKHVYEVVLLTRCYHGIDGKTGKPQDHYSSLPTKVCTICGRIDDVVWNDDYYTKEHIDYLPFHVCNRELNDKSLSLPKWHCDFFDKFATKEED